MKLTFLNPKSREGSILLVTLVTGAIVGFTLASYMRLINSQNRSTLRSTAWNSSMAVAEAGIEDSLTHLNFNCVTNPLSPRLVNWSADAWSHTVYGAENIMSKSRWFGSGWYQSTIRVAAGGSNSTITVFAGVPVPASHAAVNGSLFMAANTTGPSPTDFTVRVLSVTARKKTLFSKGMVAKGLIDMNGQNVEVDSYDSANTNYSVNGRWNAAKRKDGGSVATNSGLTNSLNVGSANIYGTTATGPGGSVSIGAGGGVGSFSYQATNTGKIQPGYFTDDMNMDFPDVVAPFVGGTISPDLNYVATVTNVVFSVPKKNIPQYTITNISTDTYNLGFGTGDYEVDSFDGKIYIYGNARIIVKNSFSLTGQEGIWIAPGASLQLYMNGATAEIAGSGIANANNNAFSFGYWGMPGNTNIRLAGNGAFTGSIYAPNADFEFGGGGGNIDQDFSGASITKSVKMNGHFNFHYDEALGRTGPSTGYVLDSWYEMKNTDTVAKLKSRMPSSY